MLDKEYGSKAEHYYAHERSEMLEYIPQRVKYVLDVGCSSGGFGSAIKKKFNCQVWGLEPDKKSAQKASLLLDKVYNAFFDKTVDFEGQRFDCIVFNDVLEHLVNPFEALEFCKELLSDEGVLVSSIPNIRFFDAMYHIVFQKDFHYVGAGIFDKTHLRFFTKRSAERMFLEAGYKIISNKGINSIQEINPGGYRNFKLLNALMFNKIADMEFQQFAIVVHL